jgi:undecaprenyl diphosphate synthase
MPSRCFRIPQHIAVIPDGNRRWAVSNGMLKSEGYNHGLSPGIQLYEQCLALGLKEMTYYGFTNDNTKRPAAETTAFSRACVQAVEQMKDRDAEILVVGNDKSPLFPEELKKYRTRQSSGRNLMKVNFLVNYDWNWDLSSAEQSKGGKRKDLLESISSAVIPRIDLIIRWGGRKRLSGMLPLQSVYADFFTIDDLWPDYKPQHLENALAWYSVQDVTLGG